MKDVNICLQTIMEKLNGDTLTPTSVLLASPPLTDPYGMYSLMCRPTQPSHQLGCLKNPKLDFLSFEDENVRQRTQKSNRYFLFYLLEEAQKALFASLHLYGRAKAWYQAHSNALANVTWVEFTKALHLHFSKHSKIS